MNPRRATPADAQELVNLRRIMFAALGPVPDGPWIAECQTAFTERLAHDPGFAAYVVDHPTGKGLVSFALGTYTPRIPGPRSDAAHTGHVHAVATHADHRRQGHARACVAALMEWLAAHDCAHVDLRSSQEGQGLYAGLGFQVVPDIHMSWRSPYGFRRACVERRRRVEMDP
jgi:ribosomal protein S18 acetylase RimI-like enzyme